MDLAIIHLTDIHFKKNSDYNSKIPPLCKAIISSIRGIRHVYFVISGDIAFSGKKEEYDVAKKFLSVIKTLITAECNSAIIKYIIVPGNHDCNFELDTQLRKNAVLNMNYMTIGEDNSVLDECLKVQSDFWDFYSIYNSLPDNKLYYTCSEIVDGKTIAFNCINTAWMSQKSEDVGSLFYPVVLFDSNETSNNYLSFGVWHHPYNWFNPSTAENNKREFELFTERLSSLNFFGHEHHQSTYNIENKNTGDKINLLSGSVFNEDNKPKVSGFQILLANITNVNSGLLKKYTFTNDIYDCSEKQIYFSSEKKRKFKLKESFINEIENVKIPIVIEDKKSIKLSEIFVFPDMESDRSESKVLDNYTNTKKILERNFENCIIDGESQIGKSALLAQLCLSFYEKGEITIFIEGKDFKDANLDKIIKKAFKSQYFNESEYEAFYQSSFENKVLLIDDFQDCEFNSATTKAIFEEASLKFKKIIVVLDSASTFLPSRKAEFNEFKFYTIKPLGYKKRNELIENYHYLKSDSHRTHEQDMLNEIKKSFDTVQSILGDKLMPSYPVFILAILQALEYKPMKQNETSFGYCYQTLIHYGLFKAGISNEDLDTYFNFLTELAYEFISKDIEAFTSNQLLAFYTKYEQSYIVPSFEKVFANLKKSKILHDEDSEIKFGYKYILYYLSAKKISDVLHTNQGKNIINNLFNNLHIERNASILVFVTHHSKDITFIEQSLLYSMIVLENHSAITLEKHDPFYLKIEKFSSQLVSDVLETNRNAKTERNNSLIKQDEKERLKDNDNSSEAIREINEIIIPFHQSFRSIEIVGQILKNRKGSLEKKQLFQMIKEVYTTGFRTIAYMSELLESSKKDIIRTISEETDESDTRFEIENKINQFIQMNNMQACLGVFTKLMHSIGIKELRSIYGDVSNELNTPAAKLVTFSINSYYGTISEKELITLSDELKGNLVALGILRARVKSYVYNRELDFKTKQKFASILNMTLNTPKRNIN